MASYAVYEFGVDSSSHFSLEYGHTQTDRQTQDQLPTQLITKPTPPLPLALSIVSRDKLPVLDHFRFRHAPFSAFIVFPAVYPYYCNGGGSRSFAMSMAGPAAAAAVQRLVYTSGNQSLIGRARGVAVELK